MRQIKSPLGNKAEVTVTTGSSMRAKSRLVTYAEKLSAAKTEIAKKGEKN